MKPGTPIAMNQLIEQVRENIPFDMPGVYVCKDNCNGCSMKLLEFLDTELVGWEQKLRQGEVPNLGDINRVAKMSIKIHRVLTKNGLINAVSE